MDSVGRAALEGAALGALAGGVGAAVGAAGLSGAAAFAVSEGADFIGGFLYDIGVNGLSREEALINGLAGIGFGGAMGVLGRGVSRALRNTNLPTNPRVRLPRGTAPNQLRRQCASFSADTLIATPDGDKPISEIEVGDVILAYSEATEEVDLYHVSATHTQHHETTLDVTIDGETLHTTDEHPFYVVRDDEEQWVEAQDLHIGDAILSALGETGIVEDIVIVDQPQTMYNLTVALVATYMVGDGQWVVHNKGICPLPHYADYGKTGLSHLNQEAIVKGIRETDPNLYIAVRDRAINASRYDGKLPYLSKPEGALPDYKPKAKNDPLRTVRVPTYNPSTGLPDGEWTEMVVNSDLDIGLVGRDTGGRYLDVVYDDDFIKMMIHPKLRIRLPDQSNPTLPGNVINDIYSRALGLNAEVVMHGSLVSGYLQNKVHTPWGVSNKMMAGETWTVFNATGIIPMLGSGYDLTGDLFGANMRNRVEKLVNQLPGFTG